MHSFSHFNYFVIDRNAVTENDIEFVQAISSFRTMFDTRVIVIDEELLVNGPFAKDLVQSGVTDLVTACTIEDIQSEILECLSAEGMQRYKIVVPPIQTNNVVPLPAQEQNRFTCTNLTIAIAGSDPRTGVTTRN